MSKDKVETPPISEVTVPFWRDKTVLAGGTVISISALGYMMGQPWVQQNPGYACAMGTAMGVLMIIFRFLTGQPIRPNIVVVQPVQGPSVKTETRRRWGLPKFKILWRDKDFQCHQEALQSNKEEGGIRQGKT